VGKLRKFSKCVANYESTRNLRLIRTFILISIFAIPAHPAFAKPFCSLRDPVTQIDALFPGYTSYKSVTKEVSADKASAIQHKFFADLRLHSKEIGKHTIYYVYQASTQIGLVHVRTERGPWGLVEIAWAMTPEGKIKDYRFQRCRGGPCGMAESHLNRQFFKGLDFEDLSDLYTEDKSVDPTKISLPLGEESMTETLIASARKTVALTSILWLTSDED